MNYNNEALNSIDPTINLETLSLDELVSDIEIDELQSEDAIGIPELGASTCLYACCTFSSF